VELYQKTAHELSGLLAKKEISARELTENVLAQIQKKDSELGAFITVTGERALETAQKVDELRAKGEELGALAGIPLAVKDNICTEGIPTTCASKMLADFIPPYSATVMEKLSLLPLVGKANLDEFAMGSSTQSSAFHPTRNPHDPKRVPGGSSGGPAAAVASGEAIMALGTDTGGSIRQPAAFCGVVGLKPTYGRVSRFGAVAFASSLDQVGPIARDVEDAALLLEAIAGPDALDGTVSSKAVPDFRASLKRGVRGMKIGLPKEYLALELAPAVQEKLAQAREHLEAQGAQCVEVSLPRSQYAAAVYHLIASAEASSNLARFDGVRYGHRAENCPDTLTMYLQSRSEGFGPEVKLRIMLGTYALSADAYADFYQKAQKVRRLIADDFAHSFSQCDCLLLPTTSGLPPLLGQELEPRESYTADLCTVSANLAGLPALSLPSGMSEEGLPVGLQLVGNHFQEETILKVAWTLEQCFGQVEVK
jgi:aspartyl-tRNA(Asn)/glutamyl-tRNA(Gln) amidotransferase subunit A